MPDRLKSPLNLTGKDIRVLKRMINRKPPRNDIERGLYEKLTRFKEDVPDQLWHECRDRYVRNTNRILMAGCLISIGSLLITLMKLSK